MGSEIRKQTAHPELKLLLFWTGGKDRRNPPPHGPEKASSEQRACWARLVHHMNYSSELVSLFTLVAGKLQVKFPPVLVHSTAGNAVFWP